MQILKLKIEKKNMRICIRCISELYHFYIGDEITYENWLFGQKTCFKIMEYLCTSNCVIYDFSWKGWSDTNCEEEYHYACEYGKSDFSYIHMKQTTVIIFYNGALKL